jgi:hypothetical protein
MPRVFYGNFDFEHELAAAGYNRPRQIERLNAELSAHLLALTADGDLLFCDDLAFNQFLVDAQAAGFPSVRPINNAGRESLGGKLIPWGCSKQVVDFATSFGWSCPVPTIKSVATANSRQFSSELEQRHGVAIPGGAEVDSSQTLESAIVTAADVWKSPTDEFDWLLKAEFGMSGRERIAGRGLQFDDSQVSWIRRRVGAGGRLFFEPRVEPLCELSTHWNLVNPEVGRGTEAGRLVEPELIGTTQLLVDRSGQYVGSIPLEHFAIDKPLLGCSELSLSREMFDQILGDAKSVTAAASSLGYHGPISVDSMVYRGPDGEPLLRPIQDVNARFTMGRLALEWCRRFAISDRPAWLLAPINWLDERGWDAALDNPVRRQTSPRIVAGQVVKRVGILLDNPADWQELLSTHLRP